MSVHCKTKENVILDRKSPVFSMLEQKEAKRDDHLSRLLHI